jgi:phosphoglycerate-specific signal transduction histidine kinase
MHGAGCMVQGAGWMVQKKNEAHKLIAGFSLLFVWGHSLSTVVSLTAVTSWRRFKAKVDLSLVLIFPLLSFNYCLLSLFIFPFVF